MKLHLPSGLRAALFACFAAFAGMGTTLTTATITGGVFAVSLASVAQASYADANGTRTYTGTDNAGIQAPSTDDIQTLVFNMESSGAGNHLGSTSFAQNIVIGSAEYAAGTTVDTGLCLNNGGQATYTFSGAVTGNGVLSKTGAGTNMYLVFTGDLTAYTGNISLGASRAFYLNFGAKQDSATGGTVGATVTSTAGVSGTGNINFTSSNNTLAYNYAAGDKPAYITNTITTGNGATSNVKVLGSADYHFTKEVTVSNFTLSATGTTTLEAATSIASLTTTEGSTLKVASGVTLTATTVNLGGSLENEGTVELNGATTLTSAIVNNGTIAFGENATLDISALTAVNNAYTLFTAGEGTLGTVTGLSLASITGIDMAGKEWTLSDDFSTLSYVQTAQSLTWSGGTLDWNVGTKMDNEATFADGDIVTFTGDTDATLGAALNSARVTVNDGVTLSLANGGTAENVLSSGNLIINGTLELRDDVLSDTSKVAAESTGTVVVAVDAGTTLNISSQLADFTGTTTVASGLYEHTVANNEGTSKTFTVNEGAGLYLNAANLWSTLTISGAGNNGEGAALQMKNSSLRGTLSLSGDATITSLADSAIHSAISGTGDLTIIGPDDNTALYLHGNVANEGKLIVGGGMVTFGTSQGASQTISVSALQVQNDAVFKMAHVSADFSSTDVILKEGGVLYSDDMDSGTGVRFGKLTVVGDTKADSIDAQLAYNWNGALRFSEVTGDGYLDITTFTSESHVTTFDAINDYNGTIANGGNNNLVIGSVMIDKDNTCLINGNGGVSTTSFTKTGEGTLIVTAGVAVDGVLTMSYEGGLYSDEAKTNAGLNITSVAAGSTLAYTTAANTLTLGYSTISSLSSLLVDLLAYGNSLPTDGIDLGITGATQSDLSTLTGKLDIIGLDASDWSLSLVNSRVHLDLKSGAALETDWDFNWGVAELATAPATVIEAGTLTEATYIGADRSAYLNGGEASIALTGGGGNDVNVFGGANEAASSHDSWIDVQGGTWGLIVGGNYANNWGSGSAATFNGTSHIKMTDGTVQYIIGGNYKDGKEAYFNGDTYISVFGGTVGGSIVGGTVSCHRVQALTTGSSHIFIYTPLTTNSGTALNDVTPNAVIGGNLHAANTLTNKPSSIESTNITIDLTGYSGEATFVKKIIGGNSEAMYYSSWGGEYNLISTINADTNIEVSSPINVTFTGDIVGGTSMDYMGPGSTVTVGGDTNITLNGGTYGNGTDAYSVVGGMWLVNGYSRTGYNVTVGGNANITLNGAVLAANANIIAASVLGDSTNTATYNQGGSNVQLLAGSVGGWVTGGYYIQGDGTTSCGSLSLGDVQIAVNGASVTGDIYGGTYNLRNSAEGKVEQGNIRIDLTQGSVGNVYAAGYQGGATMMTSQSTTVNLASGVTFAANSTVSGGYGGSGTGSTVTGNRTLNLTSAEAYTHLGNVTFKDFSVVNVVSGGSATIALAADSSITKTGEGTLGLSSATSSLTALTLSKGTLDVSATDLTVNGALTLNGGVLKLDDRSIALGTQGSLVVSSANMTTLDAGYTAGTTDINITILTGVNKDNWASMLSGITLEANDEGLLTGKNDVFSVLNADASGAIFVLDANGNLKLTNDPAATSSWLWTDTAESPDAETAWKNDSFAGWKSTEGTPSGQVVTFTDVGIGASGTNTVQISGAVTPSRVKVNVSSGKTYIFESDATTAGSIADYTGADGTGKTTLTKQGAGTLVLNLANTYSGGTTISGGTLQIGHAGALGSGTVTFDGGTLAYAVDATADLSTFKADKAISVNVASGNAVIWNTSAADDTATLFSKGMTLTGDGTLTITSSSAKNYGTSDSVMTVNGKLVFESNPGVDTNFDIISALEGTGKVTLYSKAGAISLNGDATKFKGELELRSDNTANNTPFYFVNGNAAGGASTTLALNGAIFRGNGENTIAAGTVTVTGTNILVNNEDATTTMTGDVSGSGTLQIRSGAKLRLTGNLTGFRGGLSDENGSMGVTFGNGDAYNHGADIFGAGATLAAGQNGTGYTFNYRDTTLNMNALVSGTAALTQNGSGTLVLTQNNTAGGKLTVNSGTVQIGTAGTAAAWAGEIELTGTSSLNITNVSGNAVTKDITACTGTTVTVAGGITLKHINAATLEVSSAKLVTTGDVTIQESSHIDTLDNGGTLTAAGLYILNGTQKGGNISSTWLSVGADSSFGGVTLTEGLYANGHDVTLDGASSITGTAGLSNVGTLTVNAATTLTNAGLTVTQLAGTGSLSVAGDISLTGTEDHSVGGNLTAGGNLTTAGKLTVDGNLTVTGGTVSIAKGLEAGSVSGVNSIVYTTTDVALAPEPTVKVTNTFTAVNDALSFTFMDEKQLTQLGLGNGGTFTLLSSGSSDLSSLALTGVLGTASGNTLELGSYNYTLSVVTGADETSTAGSRVIITCATAADLVWDAVAADGTATVTWGAAGAWQDDTETPDETSTVGFLGGGTETVYVGAGAEAAKVIVDTGDDSAAHDAYEFVGTDGNAALTIGSLDVTVGGLTLSVDTTVSGETVVGSQATNATHDASLSVATGTTFTTGSMVVNSLGSFTNAGTTTVTGALVTREDDAELVNTGGKLTFGAGSDIGTITGGAVVVTGDATVDTLKALSGLTVNNAATLKTDSVDVERTERNMVSVLGGATLDVEGAVDGMTVLQVQNASTLEAASVDFMQSSYSQLYVNSGSSFTVAGAVTNAGDIAVGNGSTVDVGDVSFYAPEGALMSTLTVSSGDAGATSFTADSLTESGNGIHLVAKGADASMEIGTINAQTGDLAVTLSGGAGISITHADDTDLRVAALNSTGGSTLRVEKGNVVLLNKTAEGGHVEVNSLDLTYASGSTLTSLAATALTLNVNGLTAGTPLLTLTEKPAQGDTSIKLTLTGVDTSASSRTLAGIDVAKLDCSNSAGLGTSYSDVVDGYTRRWTDYLLVDAVAGYTWTFDEADALRALYATEEMYAQLRTDADGNVYLTVYNDTPRIWNGGDVFGGTVDSDDKWTINPTLRDENGKHISVLDLSTLSDGTSLLDTALDTVDVVKLTKNTTIDLASMTHVQGNDDGLVLNHLSGDEVTLTIKGEGVATLRNLTDDLGDDLAANDLGSSELAGTLAIDGSQVFVDNAGSGNSLTVGKTELKGAALLDASAGDYRTGALDGSGNAEINGTITVLNTAALTGAEKAGNYSGSYGAQAAIALGEKALQNLTIGGNSQSKNLALSAANGAVTTLSYTGGNAALRSLNTNGAHITLNNGAQHTLTVSEPSTMKGGTLTFQVDVLGIARGENQVVTRGLNIDGTTVKVAQSDASIKTATFDVSKGTKGWTLFTLADGGTVTNVTAEDIELTGDFFSRYFKLSTLTVEDGVVKADLITDYYTRRLALTENGRTGMRMLDTVALQLNPQSGDLGDVLKSLDDYVATGDAEKADRLAAAVAGSGLASLGMALSGDVERQLKAIRNRTTTMGVDPSVVNEGMPYFNAWINGEGDYRTLESDGTYAGYTLSSWGGTVGFDMDVNPSLTWGLALTAMYGDFSADSTDVAEGELSSYYLSAFARATSGSWVHTFAGTVGLNWAELNRTVHHKYGSYTAEGETEGTSVGFLYEVARTYALNEDATACWQPVINMAYRHVGVDGYTEHGSDAALSLGDQTLDVFTIGLGARVQAVVGENIYNRTSVFEARALAKFDVGDRESEMDTAFNAASAARGTVKSAEMDAFGIELGAGLTVPVGMDAGSIFVDASVELRGSSYTSFNGTVGYRINF